MARRVSDERSSYWWAALAGLVLGILFLVALNPDFRPLRNWTVDLFGYGGPHSDKSDSGRDLFHTRVDIRATKNGETYAGFNARRDLEANTAFYGFGCIAPCGEHLEGYRWAVRHNVTDPAECGGLSWAFAEGCAAYAIRARSASGTPRE